MADIIAEHRYTIFRKILPTPPELFVMRKYLYMDGSRVSYSRYEQLKKDQLY